jgi:hypothetical protein
MKQVLVVAIFLVAMTSLMGGYFFLASRNPLIAGGVFIGLAVALTLLAAWLLLFAGPGDAHIVYGLVSPLGAAGCLMIGISTLRNGGPGRRR